MSLLWLFPKFPNFPYEMYIVLLWGKNYKLKKNNLIYNGDVLYLINMQFCNI